MAPQREKTADAFLQAFRVGAAHRGWVITDLDGDSVTMRIGGAEKIFSLVEPRRAFEGVFPDDRRSVVNDYLEAFAALIDTPAALAFDAVRDRVLPRVNPPLLTPVPPPSIPLLDGRLELYFVVNEATRMRYISRAELHDWGLRLRALLPLSIRNLRARTDWRLLRWPADPPGLALYPREDAFVASRMLLLRDALRPFPPSGAVVAVPDRSVLGIAPVGQRMVLGSLVPIARAARKAAGRRPFPVSDDLLWFDGAAWEAIPVVGEGEGALPLPTERFLDALALQGA